MDETIVGERGRKKNEENAIFIRYKGGIEMSNILPNFSFEDYDNDDANEDKEDDRDRDDDDDKDSDNED